MVVLSVKRLTSSVAGTAGPAHTVRTQLPPAAVHLSPGVGAAPAARQLSWITAAEPAWTVKAPPASVPVSSSRPLTCTTWSRSEWLSTNR